MQKKQNPNQSTLKPEEQQKNNEENQIKQIHPPPRKDSVMSQDKEDEDKKLQERKREDAKSVFLENVDYKTTKEELELIFQDCGKVTRVTIVKDRFTQQPKGCAYMMFDDEADVDMALNLSGLRHRGRIMKVHRKRTNIVGMSKLNQGERKIQLLNQMYQKLSHQNFRGRPRGRGQ